MLFKCSCKYKYMQSLNVLNSNKYIDYGCGCFIFETSISMELWDCGHMQRKKIKLQCDLYFGFLFKKCDYI